MSSITSVSPRTLADAIPGGLVRNVALVAGGAAFVGLASQVLIPLPFTPIPLSLGTFSVLLVGAVLGSKRGFLALAFFALAGMAGVPWFAGQNSGVGFASFGYVIGYVAAATLVGFLAERRADRTVLPAALAMALGNVVIYAFGVPGLMLFAGMGFGKALALGVVPFLIGDAIKIAAASALLPATWKTLNNRRRDS